MAAWALVLLLQDADRWISRFADDDPAVRDEAVLRLVEIGESALHALREAAASADPEIASRAAAAIRRIELRMKVAEFGDVLSETVLAAAPDIVEPLAGGGENDLLRVVAALRGIGEGPRYLGTAVELDGAELVPVFRYLWSRIRGARDAGTPMTRLEPVFLTALYWRSDRANGASGGSRITIDAVPADDLLDLFALSAEARNASVLEHIMRTNPPYASAERVRALLGSDSAAARRVAAMLAGRIGDRESIPLLRERLKDGDANTAMYAAESLGRLGDAESAPAIAALFDGARHQALRSAVDALAALEAYDHVGALLDAADGADDYTRAQIGRRLVDLRAAEAAERLEGWAESATTRMQQVAVIEGLLTFKPDGWEAILDAQLATLQPTARLDAARALAREGDVARLARFRDEDNGFYRAQILGLLTDEGVAGADEAIVKALESPDAALVRLAGRRGLVSAALADHDDESVARAAILALAKTDAFERHVETWLARRPTAVLEAVAERGGGLAEERIRPYLDDPATRAAARRALGIEPEDVRLAAQQRAEAGDREAIPILAPDVTSTDAGVRSRAIDLLARLHAPEAGVGLYRRMLDQDESPFLWNALTSPALWDRLAEMPLPDGAPERATIEDLAAWLSGAGVAVTIDAGVREAYRRDRLRVKADNVLALLESIHGFSRGTRVRLQEEGPVLIETNLTSRKAYFEWWGSR